MNRKTLLAASGGSGNGWNPRRAGPMLAWYDATIGVAQSAGSVSTWGDQSPSGYALFQNTAANRPTYSATAWNGARPGVSFNGTNNYLLNFGTALATYTNGTDVPLTVFATLNAASGHGHTLLQWFDNPTISTIYSIGIDTSNRLTFFNGTTKTGTANASGARRIAVFSGGGTLTTYVDSAVDINGVANSATLGSMNVLLMGANAVNTVLFSGTIVDVVAYSIKLDPSVYVSGYYPYSLNRWG